MNKKYLKFASLCVAGALTLITYNVHAAGSETKRLWGQDRYETCSEVVKEGWESSEYAVIVNGENFPDALSAASLAKKYNAPILLTESDKLNNNTSFQLKKLGVKKAFIVGGDFVVKSSVENAINKLGINTQRFYGKDRTETSIAVAKQIGTENGIIVTTDSDFTDALSVAPIAAKLQIPIILMPKDSVPDSVSQFLTERNIDKTYILGGINSISRTVGNRFPNVERILGNDKFERNISIIYAFKDKFDFSTACFAYSEKFADALSGSALAALKGNPIILIGDKVPELTKEFILDKNFKNINVLGGDAGIKENILVSLLENNDSSKSNNKVISEEKAYNLLLSVAKPEEGFKFYFRGLTIVHDMDYIPVELRKKVAYTFEEKDDNVQISQYYITKDGSVYKDTVARDSMCRKIN